MLQRPQMQAQVPLFLKRYDAAAADLAWNRNSALFRKFWMDRVMATPPSSIPDNECDPVIRVLDRNGSGNTKGCEAVAKVMIPQGAWRRMFNELHSSKALGSALNAVLTAQGNAQRAAAIDKLYEVNTNSNFLTGASGNAVGAMLAAWEPSANLSMISLNDRTRVISYLGLNIQSDWDNTSIGERMMSSNEAIMKAGRELGLPSNARTISEFFYEPGVEELWKPKHTVTLPDRSLNVSVPSPDEEDDDQVGHASGDEVRESMVIQALLARIGVAMGCKIWLPRNDRSRVLKAWTPAPGQLLETLPLSFDSTTIATIEQIDVLWIRGRAIVRAFEVEGTTAIYSGLLRMADLVALQPNLSIQLHIVADGLRREKVMREITRPVFSLLEHGALRDKCTYISYDKLREIGALPHLEDVKESILSKYEEKAEGDDDAA